MKIHFLVISYFLLTGFLAIARPLSAQEVKISISGFKGDRVWLYSYFGDDMKLVDSIVALDGNIQFNISENQPEALYHLYIEDPRKSNFYDEEVPGFDLVIDRENIEIQTSSKNPARNIKIIQSKSNEAYYRYVRMNNLYRQKLGHLFNLLLLYDAEESFHKYLEDEILSLQKNYSDSILVLSRLKVNSFIADYISFMREPIFDPHEFEELDTFMKNNFLEPVDFNNTGLINSPAFTSKILGYLSFYRDSNFTSDQQEDAYIEAIEKIMAEITYEQKVYDFVLNYLIDGFERFKMEKVLVYIADNFLSGECETDSEKIMKERMAAYKSMAKGSQVKDINLPDESGRPKRLSDNESDFTLLVFWASWCPHCQSLMPRLTEWFREEVQPGNIALYTVSIDTSLADWEEFLLLNELAGINVIDTDGWEGKIARQYNLYATPTIFLIDKNRKILSKPMTLREIRKEIDKLIDD